MENVFSISDHDVWNDLFEVWIGFSMGARLKAVVLLVKDCRQIAIHISIESLKNSKLLKKRAGKNQNIFVCDSHNQQRLPKSEFRSQNLEVENRSNSKNSTSELLILRFELHPQTPIKMSCQRF